MTIDPKERHYWTLPYGAGRQDGTFLRSPFFPDDDRHTYQLSTPGEIGELYWFTVKNMKGLLYPRLTTEDTILREFGVFQEGGTTVLLKAPVRNFSLDISLQGGKRLSYTDIRKKFAFIIAWDHCTAARPPGFDAINKLYNIPSRWGRPNPFTYTIVRPNSVAYHIDCYVQAPDPQDDTGSPDSQSLETSLKLTSDQPSIYGQEKSFGVFGPVGGGTRTEPESPPDFLLDPPFVYSEGTDASARTGFDFFMLLSGITLPTTLYSFGIYNVNQGT